MHNFIPDRLKRELSNPPFILVFISIAFFIWAMTYVR